MCDEFLYRYRCLDGRTEVPCSLDCGATEQKLSEPEISGQRFQYVLPWADSVRIANMEDRARGGGAYEIRHQAVFGPVAAADDVARAHCGDTWPGFAEKALMVALGHQLGAGLGSAVRIVSPERIILQVAGCGAPFAVYLVTCDVDEHLRRIYTANGIQQVHQT